MRVLCCAAVFFTFAACELNLDDVKRPYACDPNARLKPDAGQQCASGWSCGLDERCFPRKLEDGGVEAALARRCEVDEQCPDEWRCGAALAGRAFCVQRGVGAPSQCLQNVDCEGGWRCGFDHRCVDVNDVVTPGQLSNLRAELLSPLSQEPVPYHVSVTRVVALPSLRASGVFSATLGDAGLTLVVQTTENAIGVFRRDLGALGAPRQVTDLVATSLGPVVRFADGGVLRLLGDGGTESLGAADALFGFEAPLGNANVGLISDRRIVPDPLPSPRAVDEPIRAAAVWAQWSYTFHAGGALDAREFTVAPLDAVFARDGGGALGAVDSLSVGWPSAMVSPSFFLLAGEAVVPWVGTGSDAGPAFLAPDRSFPACVSGGTVLQVAPAPLDERLPSLVSRCRGLDGGVYAFAQVFEPAGLGQGLTTTTLPITDDLTPYARPLVAQRRSPQTRAHASSNGRVWYAFDRDERGLHGQLPLQALVLDRQPETMLWAEIAGQPRLFASSGTQVFQPTPELGLVSTLGPTNLLPLQTVSNRRRWLVVSEGVIDVFTSLAGSAGLVARVNGNPLTPPVSAFVATLGGRDVLLLSSRDALWAADVSGVVVGDPFAQPAVLEPVVVPQPGVRVRSLALIPDAGVSGFVATATGTQYFSSDDLVQWTLTPIGSPADVGRPLELWTQGVEGRVGTTDGVIWSLPTMVALTEPLRDADGGALTAGDFARKCGEQLVISERGLHHLVAAADGGLPRWAPVSAVNARLDDPRQLRLYETRTTPTDGGQADQLYVATPSGQVVEVLGDGACP